MANPEHLAILNEGVEAWNRWRRENPLVIPHLSGAEMRDANLTGVDFTRAFFGYGTPSSSGVYIEAGFEQANLRGANLSYSNLVGAGLAGADLREAQLFRTVFGKCDLCGVQFARAHMSGTVFAEVNLNGAEGLDEVRHTGPSTIGVDTIYISKGRISEHFLRQAGVPDSLITYARSLIDDPLQFYSCFISFSTKDQDFADRLHADLQDNGVRCWFAPHDIKGGRKLHEQIDEAIRIYDRLLLILSEHSMNSEWVKTEIAHARQKELNEGRQVLFPISLAPFAKIRDWKCFDADTGKDSAREIREYFVPDFSNWKEHDSYQAVVQRLVRDLKAEEKGPGHGGLKGDGRRRNRDTED